MIKRTTCIISLLLVCVILFGCGKEPDSGCNDEILQNVIDNILSNFKSLDTASTILCDWLDVCDDYIEENIPLSRFTDIHRDICSRFDTCSGTIADDSLKLATISDKRLDGELAIGEFVDISIEDYYDDSSFLLQFLEISALQNEKNFLHELVEIYRFKVEYYLELTWLESCNYLFDINNRSMTTYFREHAAEIPDFAELSKSTYGSREEIKKLSDLRWSQLKVLLEKHAIMTGELEIDLNMSKENSAHFHETAVRYLMETYLLPEDTAEKLVELQELKNELEEQKQLFREKFAPSVENDSDTLFGKAKKFASVKMYSEAIECIDVFLSKADDPECPKICGHALKALYSDAENIGVNYGLLVLQAEVKTGEKAEFYKSGDIIIQIDSAEIFGEQEYIDASPLREDGYTAIVLRLNENNQLERNSITVPSGTVIAISAFAVR